MPQKVGTDFPYQKPMEPCIRVPPPQSAEHWAAGAEGEQAERNVGPVRFPESFDSYRKRSIVMPDLVMPIDHSRDLGNPGAALRGIQVMFRLHDGGREVVDRVGRPDADIMKYGCYGIFMTIGRVGIAHHASFEDPVNMIGILFKVRTDLLPEAPQELVDKRFMISHRTKFE